MVRHLNQRLSEDHTESTALCANIKGNKTSFLCANFCSVKLYVGRLKPSCAENGQLDTYSNLSGLPSQLVQPATQK